MVNNVYFCVYLDIDILIFLLLRYWYFTVGLPTVLGINTIPFIFGVIDTVRHKKNYPVRKQLLIIILLSLSVLSTIEHKEFRFIASLLPLCLYIIADTLTRWSYNASR